MFVVCEEDVAGRAELYNPVGKLAPCSMMEVERVTVGETVTAPPSEVVVVVCANVGWAGGGALSSGFASAAGGKGTRVASGFDGWSVSAGGGGPKGGFMGPRGGGAGVVGDRGEFEVLVFPMPGSKNGGNLSPCPFFA